MYGRAMSSSFQQPPVHARICCALPEQTSRVGNQILLAPWDSTNQAHVLDSHLLTSICIPNRCAPDRAGAVQVEPWGSWRIQASNEQYRAEVEATCRRPGSMLRAPTPSNGLQPACRDSFFGKVGPSARSLAAGVQAALETSALLPAST